MWHVACSSGEGLRAMVVVVRVVWYGVVRVCMWHVACSSGEGFKGSLGAPGTAQVIIW